MPVSTSQHGVTYSSKRICKHATISGLSLIQDLLSLKLEQYFIYKSVQHLGGLCVRACAEADATTVNSCLGAVAESAVSRSRSITR
eukprot:2984326-Amphidinium_carterae.2